MNGGDLDTLSFRLRFCDLTDGLRRLGCLGGEYLLSLRPDLLGGVEDRLSLRALRGGVTERLSLRPASRGDTERLPLRPFRTGDGDREELLLRRLLGAALMDELFLLLIGGGGDLDSETSRRFLIGERDSVEYRRFLGAALIEELFLRTPRLNGERDKLWFLRGVGDLDLLNVLPLRNGGLGEGETLRAAFLGGVMERARLLPLPLISTGLAFRGGVRDSDRSRFIPLFLVGVGDLE